jgi:hypothetical protein
MATVLAMALLGALPAHGQDTARARQSGRDVLIPFTVGPAGCTDPSRTYPVTMRIYNVLAQPVAVPTLAVASSSDPGTIQSSGRVLNRLMLPCGRYLAIWNGRHFYTGRRLAAGVYISELVIDGQRATRKITLEP